MCKHRAFEKKCFLKHLVSIEILLRKKASRVMVRECDPKGGEVRVYGTSLQFYKLSILWNERPPFGLSFSFGLFFARISRDEQI